MTGRSTQGRELVANPSGLDRVVNRLGGLKQFVHPDCGMGTSSRATRHCVLQDHVCVPSAASPHISGLLGVFAFQTKQV